MDTSASRTTIRRAAAAAALIAALALTGCQTAAVTPDSRSPSPRRRHRSLPPGSTRTGGRIASPRRSSATRTACTSTPSDSPAARPTVSSRSSRARPPPRRAALKPRLGAHSGGDPPRCPACHRPVQRRNRGGRDGLPEQRAILIADGIVGPQTWPALVVTTGPGSTGDAVRAVQQFGLVGSPGEPPLVVDGVYGPMSEDDRSPAPAPSADAGLRHRTAPRMASTRGPSSSSDAAVSRPTSCVHTSAHPRRGSSAYARNRPSGDHDAANALLGPG